VAKRAKTARLALKERLELDETAFKLVGTADISLGNSQSSVARVSETVVSVEVVSVVVVEVALSPPPPVPTIVIRPRAITPIRQMLRRFLIILLKPFMISLLLLVVNKVNNKIPRPKGQGM